MCARPLEKQCALYIRKYGFVSVSWELYLCQGSWYISDPRGVVVSQYGHNVSMSAFRIVHLPKNMAEFDVRSSEEAQNSSFKSLAHYTPYSRCSAHSRFLETHFRPQCLAKRSCETCARATHLCQRSLVSKV